MAILVFAETLDGKVRKNAFEVVTAGANVAAQQGLPCIALVVGPAQDAGTLGKYGASRVLHVDDPALTHFEPTSFARVIVEVAQKENAQLVIIADSANGKSILGMIGVKLNAGAVRGVNSIPARSGNGWSMTRSVFSGKAIAHCQIESPIGVISIAGNTIKPQSTGNDASVETVNVSVAGPSTRFIKEERSVGVVPLPEAELVVSAGRGMKDPSNWGIIEELAETLGATTACSRPVADSHWRPHHEHVGQTGIAIRPNLYIAIGISGAIQHLAGVNNSKVIVVINKDPEAPFFKAADYGVVGDLFEVVPRLTEAIKKYKAAHG